jgi:hypothetical protein
MHAKLTNQLLLVKLSTTLEKVKQAQLGLDNESRIEYRQLESALKDKIREVKKIMHVTTRENMV